MLMPYFDFNTCSKHFSYIWTQSTVTCGNKTYRNVCRTGLYAASSKPKDFSQPILHIFSHTDDPTLAITFTPSDYPSNANLNLV